MKDKEATKKRILEEGKKAFIEKGFEGAYLRDIAKAAGVTTGAIYGHYKDKDALFVDLIRPILDGFIKILRNSQVKYRELDDSKLRKNPMHLHSHDESIDYIYDNLDEFLLLLKFSHETSMKDWFKDFNDEETKAAKSFQDKWKSAGLLLLDVNEEFISIISASFFQSIFEAVQRGFGREETKSFSRTLSIYYTGGWKALAEHQANDD